MNTHTKPNTDDVWFVYDGECPMCNAGANSFCLKDDNAQLHLLDKRKGENHEVIHEIDSNLLDLDKGMILKYRGELYQGADALHLMSRIGAAKGWSGIASRALFRNRSVTGAIYPFIRGTRNLLLRIKGVPPIRNLE